MDHQYRVSGSPLAFLLGVPLAWAVLLLFHPSPDVNDLYGSLQDQLNRWIVVHLGMLLFIGLTGAALYLLVRDLPGQPRRPAVGRPVCSFSSTTPGKPSRAWPSASRSACCASPGLWLSLARSRRAVARA
jgi:hypothetical protein